MSSSSPFYCWIYSLLCILRLLLFINASLPDCTDTATLLLSVTVNVWTLRHTPFCDDILVSESARSNRLDPIHWCLTHCHTPFRVNTMNSVLVKSVGVRPQSHSSFCANFLQPVLVKFTGICPQRQSPFFADLLDMVSVKPAGVRSLCHSQFHADSFDSV